MTDSQRIKEVFADAADLSAAERAAFLDVQCRDDSDLRARVESLLSALDDAGVFLQSDEHRGSAAHTGEHGRPRQALEQLQLLEKPGTVIDRYKLLQKIGEGGFGSVFMAEQILPVKRRVALKIIKLGMDTKTVIARFEAERQALAMMDHPHIARVFDAGATETGRPYFVMELVRGVPITEYCDANNLTTRQRLELFKDVCSAVQHAHQKGVIHRDLKPNNVMVTLHDGCPVAKVIDFGIAKATNAELTEKTVFTEFRQFIGTPEYMSPEQAEMSGLDIDTRSDVYSLGVLLYELLTGTTPLDAKRLRSAAINEIQRIIREEEPPRPSTRLSDLIAMDDSGTNASSAGTGGKVHTAQRTSLAHVSRKRSTDPATLRKTLRGDLDWIVMKSLEKDRTRRYESAGSIAEDIDRHLRDEPVVAGPPSAAYKLSKFVRRHRAAICAVVCVGIVLVLGMTGTTFGMLWALRERAQVNAQRESAVGALEDIASALSADLRESPQTQRGSNSSVTQLPNVPDFNADHTIAVESLASMAKSLVSQLQLARSTAERELVRANEVKTVIWEMLSSISPEEARGRDTTILRQVLGSTAARLEQGEVKDAITEAELRDIVGNTYLTLGMLIEAERHLRRAIELRQSSTDSGELGLQRSRQLLGVTLVQGGLLEEADELLRGSLQRFRAIAGDDHELTIGAMQNLAVYEKNLGHPDVAESLLKDAIAAKVRVFGPEAATTLNSKHNLVSLLLQLGRIEEAEALLLHVHEARQRLFGTDHPHTISSLQLLANLYVNTGRADAAEPLMSRALESRQLTHGNEHPLTLDSMNNLASVYWMLGRMDEAERLFRRTIDMRERVLGPEHPQTLSTLVNLGYVCLESERLAEARRAFDRCVPALRRSLGDAHPHTLAAMEGLLEVSVRSGDEATANQMRIGLEASQEQSANTGTPE